MARNIKFTGDIDELDEQLYQLDKLNETGGGDDRPHSRQRPHSGVRPQTRQRPHSAGHQDKKFDKDDENLGEDFEATPWLPPSIEKANKFKRDHIFRNGDARIDSVDIIHASDVAAGVSLYFQFAMSMAICLFIMSFLCLPELIFLYNGSGISAEDQDAFGLYRYTLGNIGYDTDSSSYHTDSKCTSSSYAKNETCIHFNGYEVSLSDAANVITAMEFLQIFVFFIGVFHLYRKALSTTGRNSKAEASISDYSIMITHLPPDTKDYELIDHFNTLYQLSETDWRGRPALEAAEPLTDCGNTGETRYQGKWIAECTLHKAVGDFISSFKNKQHIMERMYRCRARMKMYAENSPHADGHNLNLYLKAEQQMIATGAIIDKLTELNMKRSGLKIISDNDDTEYAKNVLSRVSNHRSIYYNIDANSTAGFIVFQYGESMARCINDYTRYNTFPMSLFYPDNLKFRGLHKIQVVKAPEPDQIVWEYLEVNEYEKFYLRLRTFIITVVVVVLCFVIILQASIYKQIFSSNIPQLSLCNNVVPQVYTNASSKYPVDTIELVRPSSDLELSYDFQCKQKIGSTFYATYVSSSTGKNVTKYSFDACDSQDICPSAKDSVHCPCVSTTSKVKCSSVGCDYKSKTQTCQTFNAGVVGACYCYQKLLDLLHNGAADALNSINSLQSSDCGDFYSSYSLSSALTYVSVIATTVVNVFMRTFLKILAKHEAHTSLDEYQASIMSKIFLSNFATMSILVLVAYGNAGSNNEFLTTLHIFNGPYSDFTTSWYGNVGFYLMTTFILQSFSPLVANLFMYFIGQPLLRFYHHRRVRYLKSHTIVTQRDLNLLEVGGVFDSTDHSAQLLTLLFFAMMFAPGLPLLMPLCCFAFILYFRVDKLLLCRYYQKPPNVGDAAVRMVVTYLPFAAVIRLGIGCWMLGNRSILKTTISASTKAYYDFLQSSQKYSGGNAAINEKIFQTNTFPLFVLLIFILFIILIVFAWKQLPVYWIYKLLYAMFSNASKQAKEVFISKDDNNIVTTWDLLRLDDPLRQQSSAYTGEFYRLIKHKDEIPDTCYKMFSYAYLTQLSEVEIEEGYKIQDRGDFVIKIKVWMSFDHKKIDGTRSKHGEHKKTYEVVADHRCFTYDIEKLPEYQVAIQGLREGTTSMLDYMEQNRLAGKTSNVEAGRNLLFEKAGLASNIIADYEKRKKGRNVGADGLALFEGNDDDDEENALIDTKIKQKPKSSSNNPSHLGYVAIDASDTPKTDTVTASAQPTAQGGKGSNRNFTFDDFNFDDALNSPLPNNRSEGDLTPSGGDPDESHHEKKHDEHKKKKKEKHHHSDNEDHQNNHEEKEHKKKKDKNKKDKHHHHDEQ